VSSSTRPIRIPPAPMQTWADRFACEIVTGPRETPEIYIGGRAYTPVEILACILGKLKDAAEWRPSSESLNFLNRRKQRQQRGERPLPPFPLFAPVQISSVLHASRRGRHHRIGGALGRRAALFRGGSVRDLPSRFRQEVWRRRRWGGGACSAPFAVAVRRLSPLLRRGSAFDPGLDTTIGRT
jgi:hypothetical protein